MWVVVTATFRLTAPMQARGVIPLTSGTKITPVDAPKSGRFAFSVIPASGKPLYLATTSLAIARDWITTMQRVVDHLRIHHNDPAAVAAAFVRAPPL